jgi:CelD/BcsL family acetyltransferase involved in cellulose biosynthesis
MSIELLDNFPAELDELAREAEWSSFYQTGAWIESLRAAFPRMTFRCLVATGPGGGPAGYLPFFLLRRGPFTQIVSMPFGTYGGPVVRGGESAFRSLVDAYLSMGRAARALEVGWTDFWNRGYAGGFTLSKGSTQIVDLGKGFDSVWKDDFDKAKRRQSRKAEREGLSVIEARSSAHVAAYYAIYRDRIGQWKESYAYPEGLFQELAARRERGVRLFLVEQEGEILGGHLNFYHKDMVVAWNGVMRRDSRSQQSSTFLYAHLIRHACEHGFARYNLGSSLGKQSLAEYKSAIGGEPYTYACYRRTSRAGSIARALLRLASRRR